MSLSHSGQNMRILVAPLNWGLGHAVRCIPIINHLLSMNVEVIIASDGLALKLLEAEFPHLEHHEMPGYNISYKRSNMVVNLSLQIPQMLKAVKAERKWLCDLMAKQRIHAIISDNRFGLYREDVPTVFISHQVRIPIPGRLLHSLGNGVNQFFIKKYNDVWVPDFQGSDNLSGEMSHGTDIDDRLTYIGPISRMKRVELKKEYDICVVLSGPEPQRTRLEHIILTQLARLPYRAIVVRGLTSSFQQVKCSERLEIVSFLKGQDLAKVMLSSDIVISRSGYTTLMDLYSLGLKALLVPTPGQKEQEDLAEHFNKNGIFHMVTQDKLVLERDIVEAFNFPGFPQRPFDNSLMQSEVTNWLQKIEGSKSKTSTTVS